MYTCNFGKAGNQVQVEFVSKRVILNFAPRFIDQLYLGP